MSGPEVITVYPSCQPKRIRVGRPQSAVCRIGGVSRRVRVGDTFEIDGIAGPLRVEVTAIEAVSHTSEPDAFTWNSWRPVLRIVPAATP